MLHLVNARNSAHHAPLLKAMHADRKRVFVDWLRWRLPHADGLEIDEFDDADAEYLVVRDKGGRHAGSVRLLRTEGRHLLSNVFRHLCEGDLPRGPAVREVTRLCVSPDCPPDDRASVTQALTTALVEYGLLTGVTTYTAVTDVRMLARVLAVGWRCAPLGLPVDADGAQLCALRIDVDAATIDTFRRMGRYSPVRMFLAEGLAA